VTPADIQAAAKTYFTRSRLSVAYVLPEEPRDE
jgi:zinc protease